MIDSKLPEPWLRGTLREVTAVPRAVLHALELAREDILLWCGELLDDELNLRPAGLPPVAFHIRHIARSIDRLLTYAEGNQLTADQVAAMKEELAPSATHSKLFDEFNRAMDEAAARIRAIDPDGLQTARKVGRKELPASVGGLLVHVADHTQRHVGQAITTAKLILARGSSAGV